MHTLSSSKGLKFLNVNYIMHKTGICTVYVISTGLKLEITTGNFHWSQTRDNNSVDYRENVNFLYVHL